MPFRLKLTLIVLLLTVLALLFIPLVIPVPELTGTVPPQELAGPDSRFIEVDGLEVHTTLEGQGAPNMLMLHGFGSSLFTWHRVMAPLGESGTALAFDRPAFGLTERPMPGDWARGENPYTPRAQVELTTDLMDRLGMERAVLIGSSSGAVVAMQTALEHPERVRALVLVGPAIRGGGPPAWARPLLYTPQFERIGPLLMRQLGGETGTEFVRNAWADPEAVTEDVLEGYRIPLRAENWDRALWELTKASRRPDFLDELGRLNVPTLIVTGAEDPIVPAAQSERLAQLIPGAEVVSLEQCGHLPQEECPEAFVAAVTPFLEGLAER